MSRDRYIDVLRSIGILCIILAHIYAPNIITQMRCFDVPLMLFVSGLSYGGRSISGSLSKFYSSRILRLIIPVYCFLIVFFVSYLIIGKPLDMSKVLCSFLLLETNTIGYVWVIKVFLLISLLAPFWIKINSRVSTPQFYGIIIFLIVLQSVILKVSNMFCLSGIQSIVYNEYLTNIISYSIPFLLGLRLRSLSEIQENRSKWILIPINLSIIIFSLYQNDFIFNVSSYKYPPSVYYIAYGCLISLILWYIRPGLQFLGRSEILIFIGRNTLWLYLWHIPFVMVFNKIVEIWYIKYLLVLISTLFVYSIQYYIILNLQNKTGLKALKYFKG